MPKATLRRARNAVLGGVALLACATSSACGSDYPPPFFYPVGPCGSDLQCPLGSYCIEPNPGSCGPSCRGDYDCAVPYVCKSRDRRGTGGKVSVCVPK